MEMISDIKDLPKEIVDEINKELKKWDNSILESLFNVVEYIRDNGDCEEEVDSWNITNNYTIEVGEYLLEAQGNCYRKDFCICDEQMEDEVYLTTIDEKNRNDVLETYRKFLKKCKIYNFTLEEVKGFLEAEKLNLL